MNWKSISEIIVDPISGEWGEEGDGVKVLRTTNFSNDGRLNLSDVVKRNVDLKKIEKKKLKVGDSIIEKSGGSPSQPVGRVVYFDVDNEDFICNNFTSILRLKNNDFDSRYFFWNLFYQHSVKNTLRFQNKTTGIINLQLQRYLTETRIKHVSLPTQKHIASILDKADALRQQNRQLLNYYDELLQCTFIEMFGDLSKFKQERVETLAAKRRYALSSGPFGSSLTSLDYRDEGTIVLRGLNVSKGALDLTNIKYVSEDKARSLYRSEAYGGDLVIIAVGDSGFACCIPKDAPRMILSQNFNKVTPNLELLNPIFFEHVFNNDFVQHQLNKQITDTVRTFLSLTKIKDLKIPVPPLDLQNQFAIVVNRIRIQENQIRNLMCESEILFQGLLKMYFSNN